MKLPDGVTFTRDPRPRRGMVRGTLTLTNMYVAKALYLHRRAVEAFPNPRDRWVRAWRAARVGARGSLRRMLP
jgi:hypothetical protein